MPTSESLAPLLIRLFGHVSIGGKPVTAQKHACVLAALAACPGEPVSTADLMDRIWEGDPPTTALSVLYSQIARLRTWLRGHHAQIRRATGGYVLEVEPDEVDLHRARGLAGRAAEAADPAVALDRWREAVALVPGEALAGVQGQWAEGLREAMHRERTGWLAARFAAELAGGNHHAVVDDLAAVAQAEPLAESIAASLMLALYRCGRPAEALVVFDDLRRRLREELGADPSTQLRDLHRQILDHDPGLTTPTVSAPSLLPAAIPSFTGREAELSTLDDVIGERQEAMGLAALVGPAGVGKTTLAVQWAHRVRDRFPGGQLYLNLRGFDQGGRTMPVDEALRALLELLGVPPPRIPSTLEGQAGMYRGLLAGSRTLVLLDNARDPDHVRPLLPGSPGSTVVVTSRDQMAGLVATEGARPIRLDPLHAGQARQLLANRVGLQRMQAEPEAVRQILAACGGLPLVLAIVAANAATRPGFPMAAFAAELSDMHGRLDALTGTDRATDVRAVFSWSYQALRPPAARLFRLLGLHYGQQIGVDAAASLAGAPRAQVRWLLAELSGAHLINEPAPGRYTLHDLLRAYAAELAEVTDEATERESALDRLREHYVHTGHRAAVLINPTRPPIRPTDPRPGAVVSEFSTADDADTWLGREWETALTIAHRAVAAGHHLHSWQVAWTIADYLERRGRWADALACNQTAVEAARLHGDPTMQAIARVNLGLNHTRLSQYEQAHAHLQEALRLHTASGNQDGVGKAHLALALVYDRQGRNADALRHSEFALAAAKAAGDLAGQVGSLNGIAWQNAQLGDYERCIVYARQALAADIEPGNRFRGSVWDTLGYAYHRLAQYQQAVDSYQQAVTLFRGMGIRFLEARTLARLADSHDALREYTAAHTARQAALKIFEDLGHPDAAELRKKLQGPGETPQPPT